MGSKVRVRATWGKSRSKVDEAREILAHVVFAHIPVSQRKDNGVSNLHFSS